MYNKRIRTFILPVLYSPNEPVHFLGCFTSWIRICICPYGSRSRRHFFMRIRIRSTGITLDPDPKHWYYPGFGSETLVLPWIRI